MLRSSASFACLVLLVSAFTVQADAPGGFLLTVDVSPGECRLSSVASLESFNPNRHGDSRIDWRLELRAADGPVLWEERVRNPWDVSPAPSRGQRLQFSARVPHMTGAAEAVLYDHTGRQMLAIPLDAAFFEAADEARQSFIQHDAGNRARLKRWRARGGVKRASLPPVSRTPRYENLDNDIRHFLNSRNALDMEKLRRFGSSPRRTGRGSGDLAVISAVRRGHEGLTGGDRIGRGGKSLEKRDDYTLSGTVRDAETSQPVADAVLYFYQYDFDWDYQRYLGSTQTGGNGRYSKSADAGNVYVILESPSHTLYAEGYSYTMVREDTTLDVSMFPGVRLTGAISDADGNGIGGVMVRAENPRFSARSLGGAAGDYQLVVPKNQEFTVWAEPGPPYAEPEAVDLNLDRDGRQDFTLERGYVLSGRVTDPDGAPIADATVIVRHLASSTAHGCSTETDAEGSYACAVPRDLRPSSFLMSLHSDGFVRYSGGVSVIGDTTVDVVLVPGFRVSGSVLDESGSPLEEALVRVFREERFLNSAVTAEDGSYELGLEPGTYTFRVAPFTVDTPSSLAPTEIEGVAVDDDLTLDFALQPSEAVVTVRLEYPQKGLWRSVRGSSASKSKGTGCRSSSPSTAVQPCSTTRSRTPISGKPVCTSNRASTTSWSIPLVVTRSP